MLLKDRSLKIAILISASWHFAFMIFVTPVILSGNIRKNLATVSFLGSILERVVPVPERPLSLDKSYFIQHIESVATTGLDNITLTQPKAASGPIDIEADKEEFMPSKGKENIAIFGLHPEKRYRHSVGFSDILIGGDAKNRAILFAPDLPKVIIFDSDFGLDYRVMVKFKISPHGFVGSPESVVSSGSPEIDQLALRYIRKWQFMPDAVGSDRAMEGFVTINLTAY